jgi:CubicO group peptidase (beta-lactamase class C family)
MTENLPLAPDWSPVAACVEEAIALGATAGASVSIQSLGGVDWSIDRGLAEACPRRRPVAGGQVWDVASLTKVLSTTAICMKLVDAGLLDLDAPMQELLAGAPDGVTPRLCLSHASGWPAWHRFFDEVIETGRPWGTASTRQWVLERAWTMELQADPGTRHRYSDVGMLALGGYLERLTGRRLDLLWHDRVGGPLGVDLRWGWPGASATEACPVRGRVVVGEVHDLNAAVLGGVAPYAGLFGSARFVARLGLKVLRCQREGGWVKRSVVDTFFSHGGPGSHRLGWDGVTPGGSSAGPRWPLDGVGHLGFTGCSLWLAPRQGVSVALLANRVHPVVEGGSVPGAPLHPRYRRFKALRPALHTAVVETLELGGVWSD